MIVFVASEQDTASMNLASFVIEKLRLKQTNDNLYKRKDTILYTTNESLLYLETLDKKFPDAADYIFLSKHKSIKGLPSITAHIPGNWDKAEYGGRDKELAYADAKLLKNIVIEIANIDLDVWKGMEVTHHGPTSLRKPVIFVELGSSEKEWRNEKYAEKLVDAVINAIKKKKEGISSVGFGGPHYSSKFTKINVESEFAVGHVMPKYAFKNADAGIIKQAFEKTINCKAFIIDKKGTRKEHREIIKKSAEDLDVEVVEV